MEFFIRKNATLPLLKMQVVKDGRSDYKEFMSFIETSTIYFSMQNIDNGNLKINTSSAGFVEKVFIEPNAEPEYYLYYRFTKKDTSKPGRYEGQFLIKNDSGTLILPIREKLNIIVKDSLLDDDLDYNECFVGKFECCIIGPPHFKTPTPTPTPTNPCVEFLTDEFGNFLLTENGDYIISEINPCITPTPTPTPTKICVEYLTDEFGNFILTENGDYIISEINPCVTPTPTKTPTSTNTPTPSITPTITQSETPTQTPAETPTNTPTQTLTISVTPTKNPTVTPTSTNTPTPTNTETPTSTTTNTQTPTNTPTPTQTPTPTTPYFAHNFTLCCTDTPITLYSQSSSIIVGSYLYSDTSLTTPYFDPTLNLIPGVWSCNDPFNNGVLTDETGSVTSITDGGSCN